MIRFGPAGLGGVKEAEANLERFAKLGLTACEIAFTYGVYIHEKDAVRIRKAAAKLGIKLTIHAPYYINLNSQEKKKIEDSKKRILDCLKIGQLLGAELVVFHPGFYGKMNKEETFQNIKKAVSEIETERKKLGIKTTLAAETTGKKNVFGSVDEILKLVKETGIRFCIDFAHIKAVLGQNRISYKEIISRFSGLLHIHFSGIEFGDKGEKRHVLTDDNELKEMIKSLPFDREITIINESPGPVEDSVKTGRILKEQNRIS